MRRQVEQRHLATIARRDGHRGTEMLRDRDLESHFVTNHHVRQRGRREDLRDGSNLEKRVGGDRRCTSAIERAGSEEPRGLRGVEAYDDSDTLPGATCSDRMRLMTPSPGGSSGRTGDCGPHIASDHSKATARTACGRQRSEAVPGTRPIFSKTIAPAHTLRACCWRRW